MKKSKIEWTELTWNPVTGCSKVSEGCKNCYAETIAKRFWKDRKFTDIVFHADRLTQIQKKKPSVVFVNSMSDLFHEKLNIIEIEQIFDAMMGNPQHTYLVLTKRPKNAYKTIQKLSIEVPNHIWIGISVENQIRADERWFEFAKIPCENKFVSYEPALSNVDWSNYTFIKWLIAGGESGANRRAFDINWFYNAKQWALENNICFFMKQLDKIQAIPDDLFIRELPF